MFHGSMVALVTPMNKSGEIDYDCIDKLVDWHIEQGTNAIIAAGTTGESATMSDKEKLAVIRRVVTAARERIPVIAGTGACSTQHTIELSYAAMEVGADATLIMTPAYIKPTQEGLYQHYLHISQQVPLPHIVYNVPGRTAGDILPATLARLAEISNIIGIKEATGDLQRFLEIKQLCGDTLDVYSGDDFIANQMIQQGGKGIISVTANIVPKQMSEMCKVALDGESELANTIDQQLQPLHKLMFCESNPIPVKWAMQQVGLIPAGIRLPLTELAEQYHADLQMVLDSVGVISAA